MVPEPVKPPERVAAHNLSALVDLVARLCRASGYRYTLRQIAPDLIGVRFEKAEIGQDSAGPSIVIELGPRGIGVLAGEPDDDDVALIAGLRRLLADSGDVGREDMDRPAPQPQRLPPAEQVRKHFRDYSAQTAREILAGLGRAYEAHRERDARWGPTFIARELHYSRETVSRYLNALRKAGLSEWDGVPLPRYGPRASTMQLMVRAGGESRLAGVAGIDLPAHLGHVMPAGARVRFLLVAVRMTRPRLLALPGARLLLPAPDLSNYIPSHFASQWRVDVAICLVIV